MVWYGVVWIPASLSLYFESFMASSLTLVTWTSAIVRRTLLWIGVNLEDALALARIRTPGQSVCLESVYNSLR